MPQLEWSQSPGPRVRQGQSVHRDPKATLGLKEWQDLRDRREPWDRKGLRALRESRGSRGFKEIRVQMAQTVSTAGT